MRSRGARCPTRFLGSHLGLVYLLPNAPERHEELGSTSITITKRTRPRTRNNAAIARWIESRPVKLVTLNEVRVLA